ncbi:MAG: hypothetical protein LBU81_00850 [Methanosarcinales archaeon]|jgi:hypothetical protein|nr:hypothetical protein [Methanosarcinales archaeon]
MSDLDLFLTPEQTETIDFVVSKRFKNAAGNPEPWELRPITIGLNNALIKESTKKVTQGRKIIAETDEAVYGLKLVSKCVIYPDLMNVKLLEHYGAARPEEVLEKMLLPGEFAGLQKKCLDICGFGETLDELVEEAEN